MVTRSPLIDYIVSHQSALINIDFIRELWMIPERIVGEYDSESGQDIYFTIQTLSPLYSGKLFVYDKLFYAVKTYQRIDNRFDDNKTYKVLAEKTGIRHDPNEVLPLCTPQDDFMLQPGDIANFTEGDPLDTTIGIFVVNYLFFVYPFGPEIPYLNEEITTAKMEKRIGVRLLDGRIKTSDVKSKYVNALSLFGQATEICAKGISEKTITIPQSIHDLRERLVRENKAALEAGDTSVMSDIEKQLVTAYKYYLKGDSSLHFLLKKKYFDVTLKKLFLTQGMTEVFGSPGKFTFIENPMGKGWKIDDLPEIYNEVRAGSYARAVETADGGVIAKLILRVFQDTRIDIADCGTTRGEYIDKATFEILQDFNRNYVVNKDGTTDPITDSNIPSLVGKSLIIRTPGYCAAPKGFCAKCFGQAFETLGQKAFAPIANGFATAITTSSLKKMHGTSHSVYEVDNLNKYLI